MPLCVMSYADIIIIVISYLLMEVARSKIKMTSKNERDSKVCPSVSVSVTFVYSVQISRHIIIFFTFG